MVNLTNKTPLPSRVSVANLCFLNKKIIDGCIVVKISHISEAIKIHYMQL
jgi:hypothetical protein